MTLTDSKHSFTMRFLHAMAFRNSFSVETVGSPFGGTYILGICTVVPCVQRLFGCDDWDGGSRKNIDDAFCHAYLI